MINKWDNIVSSKGSEIDVWPFLQTLTSDAISRTAFGSNYEEGRQIFELQKEQADLTRQAARWIYIPGWRYILLTNYIRRYIFYHVKVTELYIKVKIKS